MPIEVYFVEREKVGKLNLRKLPLQKRKN